MIYKYKIPNFENYKNPLINLIDNNVNYSVKNEDEIISKTDYELPEYLKREYWSLLKEEILIDFNKDFLKKVHAKKIYYNNYWFQIYQLGDLHAPHRHPNCMFTNIIFLNLPKKTLKTNVWNLDNIKLDFTVEEGDIISFPSFLLHESPKNIFFERKISISFNTNIV
jgi:hypothetical protein|tara:strand:+ start:1081 stop:1581 length:501 start_codon:yes stop_codon:yes gene_type:complete